MATIRPAARSMLRWEAVLQPPRLYRSRQRCFAQMAQTSPPQDSGEAVSPDSLNNTTTPKSRRPRSPIAHPQAGHRLPAIRVHRPPPSSRATCTNPIEALHAAQIAVLDPSGARTRLFARANPDGARVGDVLLVRQRGGEPFAGVCVDIRRRGVETGVLLRGQLTRVGVEMWFKVYSPNVEGVEVVQRYEGWKRSGKLQRVRVRPRRGRLYYLRKEKHDRGSVETVVRQYLRERAALGRGGGGGGGGAAAAGKAGPKAKTKSGKR